MSKEQFLKENQREGEVYAGLLLGKNGEPDIHLFLLPAKAEKLTWDKAVKFAADAGGDLPTRREQSLLFANLKEQFEPSWYWSKEQRAGGDYYAWGQSFDGGNQDNGRKSGTSRGRAVRRLIIQ